MILMVSFHLNAAELRTAHTFELSEGEKAPAATVEDVAWLAGSWTGTAFGNEFEEVWNPPSAGSMVGFFKLMQEGQVEFYELMTIMSDNGRLSLKVKHFSDQFVAWEDKADFVDFKLVAIDENAVHFSGLSFYRIDANTMEGYIVMRGKNGLREEKLTYRRR